VIFYKNIGHINIKLADTDAKEVAKEYFDEF
jgi:hypothetical protein